MAKQIAFLVSGAMAQDVFLASNSGVSNNDLVRAKTPRATYLSGSSPARIADKINNHVGKQHGLVKPCDDHTTEELNNLAKKLFPHLNEDLRKVYAEQDGRARRFESLSEYETAWAQEVDSQILREAKCAEVLMLWAHHIPESSKKTLQETLPTLPVYNSTKALESKTYATATSCVTGHAMVTGGDSSRSHDWPNWPEELHYTATGHGAYPFWWGGGSDSGTADMKVWWSEKVGAEKFYHSQCTGQSSWLNGPCTHLMFASGTNAGQAYLYTDSQCCNSQASGSGGSGPAEVLAPSQGNFVDVFTYNGEVDFNGVYYQGKAKYYTMKLPSSEAVTDFWYFTDLDGKPVQQGEAGTGPTDQGYPTSRGHTIWHDYNPSSLDTSGIDSSVFDIPDHCKSTTLSCAFP